MASELVRPGGSAWTGQSQRRHRKETDDPDGSRPSEDFRRFRELGWEVICNCVILGRDGTRRIDISERY